MFSGKGASGYGDGSLDAAAEKRRAMALRAHQARQKAKAYEQRLLQELQATSQEVDRLRIEKNATMQRMRMLEQTIQQYKGNKSESSVERCGETSSAGQSISQSYEAYCQESLSQFEESVCDTPQAQPLTYGYCDANYPSCSANPYAVLPAASAALSPFALPPPHHDPLVEDGGQSYPAHGSPSLSRVGGTAVKVYELPPQEDPATEAKRLRALRAFKKRQQDKEVNLKLELHIQHTRTEIQTLRHEMEERKFRIETLEKEIADLSINQFQEND